MASNSMHCCMSRAAVTLIYYPTNKLPHVHVFLAWYVAISNE